MHISFRDKLISVKPFVLDDATVETMEPQYLERAQRNAEAIEAIDFEYVVNGRKYNGFYARLKSLDKNVKHPVVILNRGGTALFGRIDAKQIFLGFATSSINAGYIVIGSQCMGFAEDGAPDEFCGTDFESVLALKDLIDADDMADASRIGVYGGSRGAIATFRLLAEVNWIKAAVVISGALDLFDDDFRDMTENYVKTFGGSKEEREKRSVLCWPEKLPKNVPILLMYGTSDWRVNPRTSLRLSEKFLDLKIPHRLVMFEGSDHFLSENMQESKPMGSAWLDRFVRNDGALPDMEPHGN